MIDQTGGTYVARVAPRSTAPIAALRQGRGVSAAAAGNAFGSAWRLGGKRAATTESDSLPGALPV